jgi:hypothetical protein
MRHTLTSQPYAYSTAEHSATEQGTAALPHAPYTHSTLRTDGASDRPGLWPLAEHTAQQVGSRAPYMMIRTSHDDMSRTHHRMFVANGVLL